MDWMDVWIGWDGGSDDDVCQGRARQPHMFRSWNNALPGQKSNTLEMKQIRQFDWEFINFKIKRSHMISVRLQGNKSWGRNVRRVWLRDKQSESFRVLWALNHSSPDATLLHLDHTSLSMSFMFASSQLFQMLHTLSCVHISDNRCTDDADLYL